MKSVHVRKLGLADVRLKCADIYSGMDLFYRVQQGLHATTPPTTTKSR